MLVVLSMRGAVDGMSLVVPHGDPVYYTARPRIAIPAEPLLVPDGFFGLHPDLAPLLPLWSAGPMAAVHATGLPGAEPLALLRHRGGRGRRPRLGAHVSAGSTG